MIHYGPDKSQWVGPRGSLPVPPGDDQTIRLAMLIEGQCSGLGGTAAARKYGFSKQRYFQLLKAFTRYGVEALRPAKRGPKGPSRRTDEVVRQVIRHRFLDPDASVDVIAQKLHQCGFTISVRSVRRVIEHQGLQKKTLRQWSRRPAGSR
jgi:transposase